MAKIETGPFTTLSEGMGSKLSSLSEGKKSAYRDAVLLNSAAALVVSGKSDDLITGVELASESIDSGKAKTALNELIKITTGKE